MALHSRPRPTRAQGQLLINAQTGQVVFQVSDYPTYQDLARS